MTTEYSISVDDWQDEQWNHVGNDLMYGFYLKDRATRKECKENGWDIEEIAREKADDHYPMMLYAYPLHCEPSDEQIIEICRKTNCTVIQDTKTDDFFLALSGGGMDLSQDVALAYLLADERIPTVLAVNVCTQPHLSVSQTNYLKIMRAIKSELRSEIGNYKAHIRQIDNDIKRSRENQAQKETVAITA